MLKQRVITALILAPLALWGIWALSNPFFSLLLGVIFAMGAWEWARLVGLEKAAARLAYVLPQAGVMAFIYPHLGEGNWAPFIFVIALMWWSFALLSVLTYPQSSSLWRESGVARAVAGVLILVPAWAALALLHQRFGPGYFILLMFLIWGADTGAYFAGRAFGRHKLAPHVSPGKTIEGVVGGLLLSLACAAVATFWLKPIGGYPAFFILALASVLISILGDLMESLFKRVVQLKDSGGLLPGHGGVMDRIDSLTSAAPLFTLGLLWLSR